MEDEAFVNVSRHASKMCTQLENGLRDIENFAKVHANDDMDISSYERALTERAKQLKDLLANEIDCYQQSIYNYRPDNSDRMGTQQEYGELVEYSTATLNKTKNIFIRVFNNIVSVIKDICKKIEENVPRIIEVITSLFLRFIYALL
jgi:hypothetical protein